MLLRECCIGSLLGEKKLIDIVNEIIRKALSAPERAYCTHFIASTIGHYSYHTSQRDVLVNIYKLNKAEREQIANKPRVLVAFSAAAGI